LVDDVIRYDLGPEPWPTHWQAADSLADGRFSLVSGHLVRAAQ
jgi:hypothetical protein